MNATETRIKAIICITCGKKQRYLAPATGGRPPSKCAKHRYLRNYREEDAPSERWVPVAATFVADHL